MNLNDYMILNQIVQKIGTIDEEYKFTKATVESIQEYKRILKSSVLEVSHKEYDIVFDDKYCIDGSNSLELSLKIIKNRRC